MMACDPGMGSSKLKRVNTLEDHANMLISALSGVPNMFDAPKRFQDVFVAVLSATNDASRHSH